MCEAAVGNNHFSSDNQGVTSERGEKMDVSSLILATLAVLRSNSHISKASERAEK